MLIITQFIIFISFITQLFLQISKFNRKNSIAYSVKLLLIVVLGNLLIADWSFNGIDLLINNYSVCSGVLCLIFFLILGSMWWSQNLIYKVKVELNTRQTVQLIKQQNRNLTKKIGLIPWEYYLILSSLLGIFISLASVTDLWRFYLYFELANIIIFVLLSFTLNLRYIKAAVIYFVYSLFSTVYLSWGYFFLYLTSGFGLCSVLVIDSLNVSTLTKEVLIYYYFGVILINLALFIKLGIFPHHIWIHQVYSHLSKLNLLIFTSLISSGYWLAFINLTIYLLGLPTKGNLFLLVFFLSFISLISVFLGSLHLLMQVTIAGFIAGNAILTSGFLLLASSAVIQLKTTWIQITLVWFISFFLLIYALTLILLYNTLIVTPLYELVSFTFYKNLIDSRNKSWQNNNINTAKVSISQWLNQSTIFYSTLTEIKQIINYFTDYSFYFLFLLFAGFPPFLLFIIKFYLTLFILITGLLVPLFSILLITNIFLTIALCRIMVLISLKIIKIN